jgi:hypothetical protein
MKEEGGRKKEVKKMERQKEEERKDMRRGERMNGVGR